MCERCVSGPAQTRWQSHLLNKIDMWDFDGFGNLPLVLDNESPLRVLFRDACFKEDAQKINIYEQFKQALDWVDDEAFKSIRVI